MQVEFKIRARKDVKFFSDKISLSAWQKNDRQFYVAQKLELKQTELGCSCDPFLEIDTHEAQQLMDDLWDCGLRPSEGSGSAGALKAVEKHLDDMKRIAFHVLKIAKD